MVSIPYERESLSKALTPFYEGRIEMVNVKKKFQFPTNGKAYPKRLISYGKLTSRGMNVSIPYKRESLSKETPFCTQLGRGSGHPKTKRELREAFFAQKFIPEIPQTLMNTDPNAIFQQNRYGSKSTSTFLDALSRVGVRGVNRVCVYKYTSILHKCQIFFTIFLSKPDFRKILDTDPKN